MAVLMLHSLHCCALCAPPAAKSDAKTYLKTFFVRVPERQELWFLVYSQSQQEKRCLAGTLTREASRPRGAVCASHCSACRRFASTTWFAPHLP